MSSGVPWKTLLRRFALRPLVLAAPFAIFFSYLMGEGLSSLGDYYLASFIFAFVITCAIEVNRAWIAPRILPPLRRPGHPLEAASFGIAAMVGSVLAATLLHLWIAPGMFGSGRAIVLLLFFSLIFTALFLGVIYAVHLQRLYVERVRREAEARTREEEELRVAAEIQRALLPPRTSAGTGFTAAGASIPCRTIGGDFYETFELPGGRAGFALADVAGKGPPAAILAALVQGVLAAQAAEGDGPAATLERVNRALCRRPVERRFATIAYAVLEPDGRLRSSTAGHCPGFLIGTDGSMRRLERGGLLAGAFESARYEEEEVRLRSGDILVLYSDGVPDAENAAGEQFGEERLRDLLARGEGRERPEEILDRVLAAVRGFASGHPPADDITILAVRYG